MPKVIITMPAYAAAKTLAKTVADIPAGVADELILVDDASHDDTVQIARRLGITVHVHPENRGYGGNQKTCYTEALRDGADIIVMLHPDYQYDPKAVPLLIAPILAGDADMTFGSRFAGLGNPLDGGMPLYRYWGNRITTTLENLMLGARFTDMHSGMRAYTRQCLLSTPYHSYSNDFVFDSQFIIDAITTGQRVVEVPIPTSYTKESSSINILRSMKYILQSLAYAARRSMQRGRRGRRNPVTFQGIKRGPWLGGSGMVERECIMCGARDHGVAYPANITGDVPVEEFACTTGALSQHDDIVQCRNCGLVSSIPTIGHDEILENYSRVIDEAYLMEEEARRELFSWFIDSMDGYVTNGKQLLEVGSNMGLFLRVAKDKGWESRGVEPSKWAVEQGVERFGVDLKVGTIETLVEPEKSADAIVMLDVLEHLADPQEALKQLRPLLADNGLLVLSTVNLSGLHAKMRKGNWPWFIRSHLYYFSEETLDAMLKKAGYRMVEWDIVPRSFHLSYISHRAGDSQGMLGRVVKNVSKTVDPKIPVGWLGDITFVAARRDDSAL